MEDLPRYRVQRTVIDSFLVSSELLFICASLNEKENVLTSHLCMEFCLKCKVSITNNIKGVFVIEKFIWYDALREELKSNLQTGVEKMEGLFTEEIDLSAVADIITRSM